MEHKCREGYKMTELGEIPQEWEVKELSEISAVITKGTTPTTYGYDFIDEGINFVKIESVNDSTGKLIPGNFAKISVECHNKLARSILQDKDILFAIAGATVGKCAMITAELLPANTNQALAIIRLDNINSHHEFIFQQLRSNIIQDRINALKSNTAQPNLNLKQIGEFKVAIPPLPEQQKIADILSTVDEQLEQTDTLIKNTKELKKGLMQRLLTKGIGHTEFKQTEIGEIPVEWKVKRLGDLFKVSSGNFLSQKNIIPGEYPVYGGNGVTGYHNEYIFEEPKIVIGRVGAKCGCVCISVPKSWITDNALFIDKKLETFDDSFMLFLLEFLELNKYANQTAQPVISGQKIYEIVVGIPPVEEQKKIAVIIIKTNKTIEQYEYKNKKLKELKKALMQKLLTGKIRVKIEY